MKPVYQTQDRIDDERIHSNARAACVASILEVPLTEVPQPVGKTWKQAHAELQMYLREAHHSVLARRYLMAEDDPADTIANDHPGIYLIASGPSPRGTNLGLHYVVYLDGKMVHDPHPEGIGLAGPIQFVEFLRSFDEEKHESKET